MSRVITGLITRLRCRSSGPVESRLNLRLCKQSFHWYTACPGDHLRFNNSFFFFIGGTDSDLHLQDLRSVATESGWFFAYDCVAPSKQPQTAMGFFVLYTTLSCFVVLSLFVGTVTLGMIDAMQLIDEIEDMAEAHEVSAQ